MSARVVAMDHGGFQSFDDGCEFEGGPKVEVVSTTELRNVNAEPGRAVGEGRSFGGNQVNLPPSGRRQLAGDEVSLSLAAPPFLPGIDQQHSPSVTQFGVSISASAA